LKRWKVDRVTIFFFIAVLSFLYDLALYLGIRDTARFPHPFVYFRSLGDIDYLRGFPGMLRQVMFSLVAGSLLVWPIGVVILKSAWLSQATIRFLRIAMWFPFLVVFAVPNTFMLGIAAAMLAALYYYLTARSLLEFSKGAAERYAFGESTLQTLFFILIAQIWVRQWDWPIFWMISDAMRAFTVCALIVALVLLINWTFRRKFFAGCTRLAILRNKESLFLKEGPFLDAALLPLIGCWFGCYSPMMLAQHFHIVGGDWWRSTFRGFICSCRIDGHAQIRNASMRNRQNPPIHISLADRVVAFATLFRISV
jgi:hypothetical protein